MLACAVLSAAACVGEAVPLDSSVFTDPPARLGLRADVVGCYALLSVGNPAYEHLYPAPEYVELSGDALRDSTGAPTSAFRARGAGRNADRLGGTLGGEEWQADSLSDSVRIALSDGFTGVVFIVAPGADRRDTLRGRAREWGDLGPTGWDRGPAEARRVACDRLPKA